MRRQQVVDPYVTTIITGAKVITLIPLETTRGYVAYFATDLASRACPTRTRARMRTTLIVAARATLVVVAKLY